LKESEAAVQLLLASNDFVLSGSTDGFQAETIILRLFGFVFNSVIKSVIDFFTVPVAPLMTVNRT
jgi:hypothetical protein